MDKCVVCGHIELQSEPCAQPIDFEYGVKPNRDYKIVECIGCGSRLITPRPSLEELISFYPVEYHAYNDDHGLIEKSLKKILACSRATNIKKLIDSRPIRLFDVGSGDCRNFDEMSQYGEFEFGGVEIKHEMVNTARKRGYDVHPGTLEDLDITPYENLFDVVTMYHLVEHVLDPPLLMSKAFRLLKPGGYLIGQTPRIDSFERKIFGRYWAGYHYPRHLQMYTKKGLQTILSKAGFDGVKIASTLHIQAVISVQNVLVGRLGYSHRMKYGKIPMYSFLLVLVAPFCIFEYLCGQGGVMNFRGQKLVV